MLYNDIGRENDSVNRQLAIVTFLFGAGSQHRDGQRREENSEHDLIVQSILACLNSVCGGRCAPAVYMYFL